MRALALSLALLSLATAWLGGPGAVLPAFSAHMTMHMTVVALAAPLLAFGVAGTAADPALRWPRLCAAVPASLAELILVWGWHTPALHHAARHQAPAFVLEQASFLASGVWLWCSAIGGQRSRHAAEPRVDAPSLETSGLERSGTGILALLLTSMHMTLLGALLALPPRALYDHPHSHSEQAHIPGATPPDALARFRASFTPLEDQHLGGAIMILIGGVSYLGGAVWLGAGLLRNRRSAATLRLSGMPQAEPRPRSEP